MNVILYPGPTLPMKRVKSFHKPHYRIFHQGKRTTFWLCMAFTFGGWFCYHFTLILAFALEKVYWNDGVGEGSLAPPLKQMVSGELSWLYDRQWGCRKGWSSESYSQEILDLKIEMRPNNFLVLICQWSQTISTSLYLSFNWVETVPTKLVDLPNKEKNVWLHPRPSLESFWFMSNDKIEIEIRSYKKDQRGDSESLSSNCAITSTFTCKLEIIMWFKRDLFKQMEIPQWKIRLKGGRRAQQTRFHVRQTLVWILPLRGPYS